jgi:hypothetical protein
MGFFGTIGTRLVTMTGTGGGSLLVDGYGGTATGGGGGGGGSGSLGTNTLYDSWDRCLCGPGTAEVQARLGRTWITRGNSAGVGGFHCSFRWCQDQLSATTPKAFVGISNTTGAHGTVDPSTLLNTIYFGYDAAQTTYRVMSNDGAGTATQNKDLGANFPANTTRTDPYEGHFWCLPNASSVNWSIINLGSGVVDFGTISADLPGGTVYLCPHFSMANTSLQNNNLAVLQFICETPN